MRISLIAVLASLTLGPFAWNAAGAESDKEPPKDLLVRTLVTLGNKFDCYFTIEQGFENGQAQNWVAAKRLRYRQGADLKASLKALGDVLPDLEIRQDRINRVVYHVVDRRLAKHKNYAMSSEVKSVAVHGNLHDLGKLLKEKGLAFRFSSSMGVGGGFGFDNFAKVSIEEFTGEARSLMVNVLPLAEYGRVLYQCYTPLDKDEPTTLAFGVHGRGLTDSKPIARFAALSSKGAGLLTYRQLLVARSAVIKDATRFIETANDKGSASHIRWALRLLGDMHAGESVGLLAKWADYRYTEGSPIEESLPSAYALTKIGKAAVIPLLEEVESRNALSADFVLVTAYVLNQVEGEEAAIQTVSAKMDSSLTPKQKKKFETVLTKVRELARANRPKDIKREE